MVKTTVYLPEQSKRALARLAKSQRKSEAKLIREAVELLIQAERTPKPTMPLFRSRQPDLADRVDEYLSGFGG